MVGGPEQCHSSRSIHSLVLGEFCPGMGFGPVVLLLVAEGSEVLFNDLGLLLSQAVSLRVEGGQESVVKADLGADSSPASPGQLRYAVGDDIFQYCMLANHMFKKHPCQFR